MALLWRLGVAALCLGGLVVLFSGDPSAEDDPLASVAVLALPFAAGLLIARAWALVIALSPFLLHALYPDTGDLATWWALSVLIILFAVMIGMGLGVHWLWHRAATGRESSSE